MSAFVITGLFFIIVAVGYELRRSARIHYLERSEVLHMRYSDLRHRLVLFAGSDSMQREDRQAFEYLYLATTLLLRYQQFYKEWSTSACLSLMTPDLKHPPKITPEDFSDRTKALLVEYLEASDDLIQQFAHPMLTFFAFLSGKRVLEWASDAGKGIKEAKENRKLVKQWRDVGQQALGATA
jgi:hypothetical protein